MRLTKQSFTGHSEAVKQMCNQKLLLRLYNNIHSGWICWTTAPVWGGGLSSQVVQILHFGITTSRSAG